MSEPCTCGSNRVSNKCCMRFLSGDQTAKTPEQLMRSRYSAYALGSYGKYLLQTWFPPMAKGMTELDLSQKSCEWTKLEVLHSSQTGDEGMVEFNAYFIGEDGGTEVLHEKSIFQRVAGRWFYVGGEVDSTPGVVDDTIH